ncbi:tumor necrosis factor receptor superfamily member 12A [Rhinophrynus dorsalis]
MTVTGKVMLRHLLHSLLLLQLLEMSKAEQDPAPVCPSGRSWSVDLGKCMDCNVCKTSNKSDFCQTCDIPDTQPKFPWLLVGGLAALGVAFLTVILSITVYLTHCRRKNKFTTPIEETGAHSAEELLIH